MLYADLTTMVFTRYYIVILTSLWYAGIGFGGQRHGSIDPGKTGFVGVSGSHNSGVFQTHHRVDHNSGEEIDGLHRFGQRHESDRALDGRLRAVQGSR